MPLGLRGMLSRALLVPAGTSNSVRRLRDAGCCGLCALRLVGVANASEAGLEDELDRELGAPRRAAPPADATAARALARTSEREIDGVCADRRKVRVLVTTHDASLFVGAKILQLGATTLKELQEELAQQVGFDVPLVIQHNNREVRCDSDVAALGPGAVRLTVKRAVGVTVAAAPGPSAGVAVGPPKTCFTCTACVGTMQHAASRWRAELAAQIQSSGFELPAGQCVSVGISIPSDCLVRQRLLWMLANECRDNAASTPPLPRPVDLKIALHRFFEDQVTSSFGGKLSIFRGKGNNRADLELLLSWTATPPLREAERVARGRSCGPQHQRKRQRGGGGGGGGGGGQESDMSWNKIKQSLERLDDFQLRQLCQLPPPLVLSPASMAVQFQRQSVYVAGRYNKYERGLTQTPWQFSPPGASSVRMLIETTPDFMSDDGSAVMIIYRTRGCTSDFMTYTCRWSS